ncbi:MAG: sugar phosphate nucleotidyltransferase [Clostridia bacterium]
MKKPILLVMAAGMGSRYGGLKQIDPVGVNGEIIMDYSVFDAKKAGFEKVVFVIKKENEEDFKQAIGDKISKYIEVKYAYQNLADLPNGFEVPAQRVKPWGTGHAVLSAKEYIDAPFVAINADDYYGGQAFQKIYDFLTSKQSQDKMQITMVGYLIKNTLSENGHVSRGVCEVDENSKLTGITERTRIERVNGAPAFTENDGETWENLSDDTIVSMNMWGFPQEMMQELEIKFKEFLLKDAPSNPLKAEFFLPFAVNDLLEENKGEVTVLKSEDKWYGVTYKEDKEIVKNAMKNLAENGTYPNPLWK